MHPIQFLFVIAELCALRASNYWEESARNMDINVYKVYHPRLQIFNFREAIPL